MTARPICAGPARWMCSIDSKLGHLCFDLIEATPPSPGALVAKVAEGVDRSPGRASATNQDVVKDAARWVDNLFESFTKGERQ